jgi:cephalosporin-C deacetylase-like acetyl esterase
MKPSFPTVAGQLTLPQLAKVDECTLLQLHQEAESNHDDAVAGLIRAEVARRIKFDLLISVAVYDAFVPPYRQTA